MPNELAADTEPVKRYAGFSLIEIAIVLVVASMVMGALLPLLNSLYASSKASTTTRNIETVKMALINFAARNNRLPCPANPTLASTHADYGKEPVDPGTCTGAVVIDAGANQNARGIIPWVALGIPDEATLDGLNNRLTYQVVTSQTAMASATEPNPLARLSGNIAIYNASPLASPTPGTQINVGNLAVAVIISHGKNAYGAYLPFTGIRQQIPPAAALDETENTDDNRNFVQKEFSDNAVNPFDDIVLALKPSDILNPLVSSGAAKGPEGATNDNLIAAKNALIGYIGKDTAARKLPYADAPGGHPCTSAGVQADGGFSGDGGLDGGCLVGYLPYLDLNMTNPSIPSDVSARDYWGRKFRYTVYSTIASSGLTTALTCPNAFEILSAGPNGIYGDADDRVFTISCSSLTGLLVTAGYTVP